MLMGAAQQHCFTYLLLPARTYTGQIGQIAGGKDEPTGADDLLEYYNLGRIYDHAVALQPVNYLKGVAGDTVMRR